MIDPPTRRRARASFLCLSALLGWLALSPQAKAGEPWRLDDAFPDWLSLGVAHRTRYEYLDEGFRAGRPGDKEVLVLRTLVDGRLTLMDGLVVGAEFEDSRVEAIRDARLTTGIVDAAELLRAYLEITVTERLPGTLTAQLGRITLDVGSRRLVARNRFRNTINGFDGIDVRWKGDGGHELRAFWTLPVRRRPDEPNRLRHNHVQFDHESFDFQFWGLWLAAQLPWSARAEVAWYGLHEDRINGGPTRQRSLHTPAFRVFREPEAGRFDYQMESALQFGRSRLSANGRRLDHFAHFHHAEVGYTLDAPWTPRVVVQYDYASGDRDPNDGDDERFDTLFGARRFDFGPTGIYGPFARANLNTPGVRVQVKPRPAVTSFLSFRGFWLAADRDAWATTGVRDPTGKSGHFVGSQVELRVRWQLRPHNVLLEAGYAHLFAGEFMHDAPNASHRGDSNYVYSQVTLAF